jgi:polyisoprenoid-binding protein YceI
MIMKLITTAAIAASLFLTAACEDPSANKPKATVTNSSTSANQAANSGNANTVANTALQVRGTALAITPENSKVEFTGSKVTGKHDGGFKQFTGTIDLVNAKPEESSVSVDIDAASVFSDNPDLTTHLKSKDFFDVEKFPKAGFKSTSIVADSAKGANNYTVTGDLTLHGVTKSVTFPATIVVSDAEVAVNADFSINRKDFEIVYTGQADDLIRDNVVIRLDLKTPRK